MPTLKTVGITLFDLKITKDCINKNRQVFKQIIGYEKSP